MERPILFSVEMMKANSNGIKNQTRRTRGLKKINENPDNWRFIFYAYTDSVFVFRNLLGLEIGIKCPYGVAGDILWFRETFTILDDAYLYKASNTIFKGLKWKPSIHMPYTACRMKAKIISIRPERLQSISFKDAVNEGIKMVDKSEETYKIYGTKFNITGNTTFAPDSYKSLWIKINGLGSWEFNPWVWRIEYSIIDNPLDRF